MSSKGVLNIAHRGASGRFPENTLCAFRAAIEAGADMCELDVQLSRDGAVVVIHDETLDRTTDGKGPVAGKTLAEIKLLEAAAGQGAAFASERVPTLDEVFGVTRERCGINIELKCRAVERRVCEIVIGHNALQSSVVSSFDWDALRRVQENEPRLRVALLGEDKAAALLQAADEMKAFAVNPRFDLASREFCAEAHRRGLKVYAWTVDDPQAIRAQIENGVDGIMTNYPERLAALLRH